MGISGRSFTREFKLAAVKEVESGKSVGYVAQRLEIKPNLLHRWRQDLRKNPGRAFSGNESREAKLERKIGQLTMENDFLGICWWFSGATGGRGWRQTIYETIGEESQPVTRLCKAVRASRAGYYRFKKRSGPTAEEMALRDAIQKIAPRDASLRVSSNYC